jgi:glycerol-3-phosphate dehydrogenase
MELRKANLDSLSTESFDVFIVGGGINGSVAAAALSGRGLKVALVDRGDFASSTSMNSSNLAWGGIKYMEAFEFALVRDLCRSRNLLMNSYPSSVREIRFLTTLPRGFRKSLFTVWLGAWLYWIIGNGQTLIPRLFGRREIKAKEPIIQTNDCLGGIEYSDAYLYDNDSRFSFNFVRTALDLGCIAANYVESQGAKRENGNWVIDLRDAVSGRIFTSSAKVLINAAGPFADDYNRLISQKTRYHHIFSKGVHLIVRRLTTSGRVLAFFGSDGRLFFIIPMGDRTCIGTTDTLVKHPQVGVEDADVAFILENINSKLALDRPLRRHDVISMRCGVRPLAVEQSDNELSGADFLQLSRKHVIDINKADQHLTVFGGKLTDCINVGNEICSAVRGVGISVPDSVRKWYGEPTKESRAKYFHLASEMGLDNYGKSKFNEALSTRLWRRYGEQAFLMLDKIKQDPWQAEVLIEGTEYRRCELTVTADREMIVKLEDFLRRRSKIAMVTSIEDIRASAGIYEACEILFGLGASEKIEEYFASS